MGEEEEEHDKSKIHTLTHFLTQSTLGHLICSYLSFLIISHFSAHQLTTHTHTRLQWAGYPPESVPVGTALTKAGQLWCEQQLSWELC